MGKDNLTIVDLIKCFIDYAVNYCGVKSFLPFSDYRWHEFLFELKKDLIEDFSVLECISGFDWDGPFPRLKNLQQINFGLMYMCHINSYNWRIILMPNMELRENLLILHYPQLIEEMFRRAEKIPEFFENKEED